MMKVWSRVSAAGVVAALAVLTTAIAVDAQDAAVPEGTAVVLGEVVAEDTGAPVPGVGVELLFAADSSAVSSTSADAEGRFRIGRVPEGTFLLRLSSLGYGTVHTQPFEVAAAETRNLGVLRLPVEALAIEGIIVSAERTAVTYEADRTAYNVGVMPGTEGASVTETLSRIPELQVDINGEIMLRNTPVAVYIDGRPAPMTGEALAVFLEQFPADYLQEIEVIDNPSARYDAEGSGGIVNLVTKEGVELGLNGLVFVNGGTRGQYGAGARGTFQRGSWTVDGGGFLRLSDRDNTSFDLRQNLTAQPPFLRQDSWSDRSGLSSHADFEVRYEPGERTSLEVDARVSRSGSDAEGLTTTTYLDELESPTLSYDRSRLSDSRNLSLDFAAEAQHEWGEDSELDIELEYERGRDRGDTREEITELEDVDQGEVVPSELTLEREEELERELSLDVDFTSALGEATTVELGYQAERGQGETDHVIEFIEDPVAGGGTMTDRGFEEREVSHSVYTTVERSFGDALSMQVGLRAERVDLEFELPTGESFGKRYTDLFPSANVSYQLDESRQLRLSYSRRIGRPGISVLNPIDRSTDPLRRRVGNPEVDPRYTNSLTLDVSWSGSLGRLRLSPYYSRTSNDWSEITRVDSLGVSIETYENIASRERYGASLTYAMRQLEGWHGYLSLSAAHEDRDASNLAERYSGSSIQFSSRANVTGEITDALSAQGNFSYYPPTELPQGRIEARYRADFGLRYKLLDDRATIRLSLEDPFGLRESSRRLRDVDYILLSRSEESTRSAELSVSYSFGGFDRDDGPRRRRRGR